MAPKTKVGAMGWHPGADEKGKPKTAPFSYSSPKTDTRPLVDRHGHRHSETLLRNWSLGAIRALGIKRVLLEANYEASLHRHRR